MKGHKGKEKEKVVRRKKRLAQGATPMPKGGGFVYPRTLELSTCACVVRNDESGVRS